MRKMLPEIKLVILENSKVIETITKETNAQPKHMISSLRDFQAQANAALTKMIEKFGDSGGDQMDVEVEEDSDEDDKSNIPGTPKKRKN